MLAGLGSLCLIASTWMTWYAFTFPQSVLDEVDSFAGQLGPLLGGLARQGASALRAAGPIGLNAHQVFHAIDVELVLLGVLALVVVLSSLTRARPLLAGGDAGAVALLGSIACALVLYRMLKPPGPAGLLSLRAGAWIALASAATVLAGGLLMRETPERIAHEAPDFSGASF